MLHVGMASDRCALRTPHVARRSPPDRIRGTAEISPDVVPCLALRSSRRRCSTMRRPRWRACARSTTPASTTCATRCSRSSPARRRAGPRARLLPVRARPHRHRRARRLAPQLRLRRRPRHLRDDADPARPVRAATTCEQFRLLLREPRRRARGRHQRAADPGALLVRRARPHRRHAERRAAAADARPVRPARPGGDGRRHRQRHATSRGPASRSRWRCSPRRGSTTRCTGCATTPAPRPSTSRTSCCSPTTSSTSTSSSASATRRWPSGAGAATTSPSSSPAT